MDMNNDTNNLEEFLFSPFEKGMWVCAIIALFVGLYEMVIKEKFSWWFLIGIGMCILPFVTAVYRSEAEDKKRRFALEEIAKLENEASEAINQSAKNGTWAFPTEKFYQRCVEQKAVDLLNEYGFNKARIIAEGLIQEECPKADMACFQSYLTKEKLQEFLNAGKPQVELTAKRQLVEKKRIRLAKAYPYEATFVERASAVSNLTGCEKRVKMLTDLLHDCDQKIEDLKAGEKAMEQLAMVYAGAQKKESDWAILGGAANGIAGPAASAAVIWDTMKKNGEIAKYNEGMRKASADVLSGTLTISGNRYKVEKERENVKQRLEEAKGKVSLSKPDAKEIFESFYVDAQYGKVTKNESGVLECALNIQLKKPLVLDVPEGLNMVVDGTIRAKVMMEEIYVGDVDFPLPIYGIPSDMTKSVTLDGMCDRSMEYDGKYTLELAEGQNLWVMEA